MYLFESLLWRLALPLVLTGVTVPILSAAGIVAASLGVGIVVFLVWLVVINGGFLLFDGDGDLNWFD